MFPAHSPQQDFQSLGKPKKSKSPNPAIWPTPLAPTVSRLLQPMASRSSQTAAVSLFGKGNRTARGNASWM
jgi:hypothetical protein